LLSSDPGGVGGGAAARRTAFILPDAWQATRRVPRWVGSVCPRTGTVPFVRAGSVPFVRKLELSRILGRNTLSYPILGSQEKSLPISCYLLPTPAELVVTCSRRNTLANQTTGSHLHRRERSSGNDGTYRMDGRDGVRIGHPVLGGQEPSRQVPPVTSPPWSSPVWKPERVSPAGSTPAGRMSEAAEPPPGAGQITVILLNEAASAVRNSVYASPRMHFQEGGVLRRHPPAG